MVEFFCNYDKIKKQVESFGHKDLKGKEFVTFSAAVKMQKNTDIYIAPQHACLKFV